jgi:UrcA family protein
MNMNTIKTLSLMAALSVTIGAMTMNTARADATEDAVPQRVVKFADLNLNSTAGVAALYSRIQRAAGAVCPFPTQWDSKLRQNTLTRLCRVQAIDRAVAAVHSAALQNLHFAKTGRAEQPMKVADVH